MSKLQSLKEIIKKWKGGNRQYLCEKTSILDELNSLNKLDLEGNIYYEQRRLVELRNELELVLVYEEIGSRQKIKLKWVKEGNANTSELQILG